MAIPRFLEHPLTRGADLDSPETTNLRRKIIESKPFLRRVYEDWYRGIVRRIPDGNQPILELGSGGGFFGEFFPTALTSEIFPVEGVDRVVDARSLPFEDESLRAIVMTNVFHHIPDVAAFLSEAQRTLRPGGRIIMVEPWNTAWSRFVHGRFHDEPMLPDAQEWAFPDSGPLSGANAALAWIVVERDRNRFESEWHLLKVSESEPLMPIRYVVSGGVSLRSLQPGWMYPFWRATDEIGCLRRKCSVFAMIVIERTN
ncbi:MAG: methyltransferase domain-containing protein [Acidimicrobiia bacterium]